MTVSPLQELLAALPLPAVAIGRDERIAAANDRAISLCGMDARGRHYITALRQPALLDAIEAAMAGGGLQAAPYLSSDGAADTNWRVTVAPAPVGDGAGLLLTFEDQTAVESAGAMRRDFVANVSHELRTPLTALLGFIETLRGPARDDPEAQARFLDIMEGEAARMQRLVEDLLSLSRVEDQERHRPTGRVDLGELIDGVVDVLAGTAREFGAKIDVHGTENGVEIPGDAEQLRQVLVNLVGNAIKYGGGGPVEVRLEGPAVDPLLRARGVKVVVRDHGEGIEPHHIARLTERFYRVDTHRSREVGGTGLGLAIVKHVVNRHRGRLRIESRLGQGSRFTVHLPAD